jgi:hypothetical protein
MTDWRELERERVASGVTDCSAIVGMHACEGPQSTGDATAGAYAKRGTTDVWPPCIDPIP